MKKIILRVLAIIVKFALTILLAILFLNLVGFFIQKWEFSKYIILPILISISIWLMYKDMFGKRKNGMRAYIVEVIDRETNEMNISQEGYDSFEKAVDFITRRAEEPDMITPWSYGTEKTIYKIKDIRVV